MTYLIFKQHETHLAHRADLPVWPGLQPLVEAGPAEQVSTHGDHSIPGSVEADVALKGPV